MGRKFIDNEDSNWINLLDELVECRSKYVPTKTINKGNYPKWMKKRIKKKLRIGLSYGRS